MMQVRHGVSLARGWNAEVLRCQCHEGVIKLAGSRGDGMVSPVLCAREKVGWLRFGDVG